MTRDCIIIIQQSIVYCDYEFDGDADDGVVVNDEDADDVDYGGDDSSKCIDLQTCVLVHI